MDEILNMTSMIAAEAVYELDPCDRIEKWYDNIVVRCNPQKKYQRHSYKSLGKFLGKLGKYKPK